VCRDVFSRYRWWIIIQSVGRCVVWIVNYSENNSAF